MILILGWAFRWSPLSSPYLRTSWTQVFTEICRPDCVFHAFFYVFAYSSLSSYVVGCLANVKDLACHSTFKECAEVDGTFVPALIWSVQVHFCWILSGLCVNLIKWDFFAAGASVKGERPFGMAALRRSSRIRFYRKTLMHRCLLWWKG